MKRFLLHLRLSRGIWIAALVLGAAFLHHQDLRRKHYPSETAYQHRREPATQSPLAFTLTNETFKAGFVQPPSADSTRSRVPHVIRRLLGASVAVTDVDNDGFSDVFLTYSEFDDEVASTLFRNRGDGTFENVTAKAGLQNLHSRGFFFDFDNSGRKGLLVLAKCPQLYRNDGKGRFTRVPEFDIGCHCEARGANLMDYNEDGLLDLIYAPFSETCNEGPDNRFRATNGGRARLYRNLGGGRFTDVTAEAGLGHLGFTHAVGVYDLRGTGRQDLWFANDWNVDRVYFNEGSGKFKEVSDEVTRRDFHTNGMTAEIADIDDDGRPAVFVGHIFERRYKLEGSALWKSTGKGRFDEIAQDRGTRFCGWNWGAKFADLDNDGDLDLVAANGYRSGDPWNDFYYYTTSTMDAAAGFLLRDPRNWPRLGTTSWGGHESACLFLNGGGTFTDVSQFTDLGTDYSDKRGVAAFDALNDGSISLMIANQHKIAHYFRNRQNNKNSWIGFKLVGTHANRDGYGATIRVRLRDERGVRTLSRELEPLNGFSSQSDDRLHFGLGAAGRIESVEIQWPPPKRTRQVLHDFSVNRYNRVVEPR